MTRSSLLTSLCFAASASVLIGALTFIAPPAPAAAASAVTLDTPTIAWASATTDFVDLTVTAGPSGATGGFSIHWITAAELAANGGVWPESCRSASFSGRAFGSRYNLEANESVTVRIGELLLDRGASTNFADPLECGTEYAFRVFAHAAGGGVQRSAFSEPVFGATEDCSGCDAAVHSQAYWVDSFGTWPTDSLSLGSVFYWDFEIQAILSTPANGNGYLILAHQLITAELNLLNGAGMDYFDAISADLAAGHILMGGAIPPPVGVDEVVDEAAAPHAAIAEALDAARAEFDCDANE
jgi:hypothetical protein